MERVQYYNVEFEYFCKVAQFINSKSPNEIDSWNHANVGYNGNNISGHMTVFYRGNDQYKKEILRAITDILTTE